jgi:general stress protein 26
MRTDTRDTAAVEKRLWDELEQERLGMLGAARPPAAHFSPMTAFAEPESGRIWFYTNRETDLAQAADRAAPAMFIVMSKDQNFQACVRGELIASLDTLHRDKYWTPVVSAWFPKGKDDPGLTMLCFTCQEADVWISDEGAVKFGWEIAKANLTGSTPDIGGRAHLLFH